MGKTTLSLAGTCIAAPKHAAIPKTKATSNLNDPGATHRRPSRDPTGNPKLAVLASGQQLLLAGASARNGELAPPTSRSAGPSKRSVQHLPIAAPTGRLHAMNIVAGSSQLAPLSSRSAGNPQGCLTARNKFAPSSSRFAGSSEEYGCHANQQLQVTALAQPSTSAGSSTESRQLVPTSLSSDRVEVGESVETALANISIGHIIELKSLSQPPAHVQLLLIAVLYLLNGPPSNDSKDLSWIAAKKMLADRRFLTNVKELDWTSIPKDRVSCASSIRDEMGDQCCVEVFRKCSRAAAGLCAWLLAVLHHCSSASSTGTTGKALERDRPDINQRQFSETHSDGNTKPAIEHLSTSSTGATAEAGERDWPELNQRQCSEIHSHGNTKSDTEHLSTSSTGATAEAGERDRQELNQRPCSEILSDGNTELAIEHLRTVLASLAMKGVISISEDGSGFINNISGFIKSRDTMDSVAGNVLPHSYMLKYPSFNDAKKMQQSRPPQSIKSIPAMTLKLLHEQAAAAHPHFAEIMHSIVKNAGLNPDEEVYCAGQPLQLNEHTVFRRLTVAPLKCLDRCAEKVAKDYDGDPTRLVDVLRCSIVVDTEAQLETVAAALSGKGTSQPNFEIVRLKNRFKEPLFNGYRDALYNVRVRIGTDEWHVCEVQLHLSLILMHKADSHRYYAYFRSYFAGNMAEVENRMQVLESLSGAGGQADLSTTDLLHAAMESGDLARLHALADLLDLMGEYTLVAHVQHRRAEVAMQRCTDLDVLLAIFNHLADSLKLGGEYGKSMQVFQALLSIGENTFSPEHRLTVSASMGVASIMDLQCNWTQALEIYARILPIMEKSYGPDHDSTVGCLHNMAIAKNGQRKHAEALELLNKVKCSCEKSFGLEHLKVANILYSMGQTRIQMGDYSDDTLQLFNRSLQITEKARGVKHPFVADALNCIAIVYGQQNNHAEALNAHAKSLPIFEAAFGPESRQVADVYHNMGNLKMSQTTLKDNLEAAFELYNRALLIRQKTTGPSSADVADSLECVARVKLERGDHHTAVEQYDQVLSIRRRIMGDKHPQTGQALCNMANAKMVEGNFQEASKLGREALSIMHEHVGLEHPVTANCQTIIDFCEAQSSLVSE